MSELTAPSTTTIIQPQKTSNNTATTRTTNERMGSPSVGLGTLGLKESAAAAVKEAMRLNVTVIDTGECYDNLELVGNSLNASSGDVNNFQLPIVVVKLSGLPIGEYYFVKARLLTILGKLRLKKADVCLMHWPGIIPQTYSTSDSSALESPESFQEQGLVTAWPDFSCNIELALDNMKKLKDEGLISEIGTSNFYQHHLVKLSELCSFTPYCNEIYIDVTNQETEFVSEMQRNNIKVLAYRSLIYKPYPESIQRISERLTVEDDKGRNISPQNVILAWLLSRGIFPLVKCRGSHIEENFSANEVQAKLTEEDLKEITSCEIGMKFSSEWFAKIWKTHNQKVSSEIDENALGLLIDMGVDESVAKEALIKAKGNLDIAMDMAFS